LWGGGPRMPRGRLYPPRRRPPNMDLRGITDGKRGWDWGEFIPPLSGCGAHKCAPYTGALRGAVALKDHPTRVCRSQPKVKGATAGVDW